VWVPVCSIGVVAISPGSPSGTPSPSASTRRAARHVASVRARFGAIPAAYHMVALIGPVATTDAVASGPLASESLRRV